LPEVIASAVGDLVNAGGTGSHVHFDNPEFAGLVPPFEDTAWIELAKSIVAVALRFSDRILVDIPVGSWKKPPSRGDLVSLRALNNWEPPGIYLVPEGESAFDHRITRGWYSDEAPKVAGANGWWGGYLDSNSPTGPIWRISLLYETKRP
jgi:hypothetical protein